MWIVRLLILSVIFVQSSFASTPSSPSTEHSDSAPSSLENPSLDTHSTPLPSSQEMTDSYQHAFIRMLLSLAGLLVLVVGTFWILKRLGKGKFRLGSSRNIQIVEKRSLSPKTVLYIIELNGKQVLLSESQLEVRVLSTTLETNLDHQEE